jgi:hypothetical protein
VRYTREDLIAWVNAHHVRRSTSDTGPALKPKRAKPATRKTGGRHHADAR